MATRAASSPAAPSSSASDSPAASVQAIKAVVFDAYGTLFDVHSVTSLAEQLFPGKGGELSRLWRRKQLEYSWLRTLAGRYKPFGEITRDALRHAGASLALPLDDRSEKQLMAQYASLSAFPEARPALRGLKAAGLPLGILSNGDREMLGISLRSAGMAELFDHILSSQAVEAFKTAPALYALAPAAFGCRAREILFVSSNGWDAIGARWHGFTSFWVNREGAAPEQLDTEPDHVGSLLTDVLDRIR